MKPNRNLIKPILLYSALLFSSISYSQKDSIPRNMASFQFGGQSLVSLQYEHAVVFKKCFQLRLNVGHGLNNYADDRTPGDTPTMGLYTGLISTLGSGFVRFDAGIIPATYFYRRISFININSWLGLRFGHDLAGMLNVSVGYTPMLYTSYSNPNDHFVELYQLGLKFGVVF